MQRALLVCLIVILLPLAAHAAADPAGLQQVRGRWRITELTDNGSLIPQAHVATWLPSGGRIEFIDNTIQFKSRLDGKKNAKTFSVDATVYPPKITVATRDTAEGWGIYRFDQGRLIVCMSDPRLAPCPTEFSAPKGSNRMLMVLERDNTPAPKAAVPAPNNTPPPANPGSDSLEPLPTPKTPPAQPSISPSISPSIAPSTVAAVVLTDAQVVTAIQGRWQFNDGIGIINVTFEPTGRFFSTRAVQNATTYHAVFTTMPVSNGTWRVQQGQLILNVVASIYAERANHIIPMRVRSVSATDLIFVDALGRVGRAVKLP